MALLRRQLIFQTCKCKMITRLYVSSENKPAETTAITDDIKKKQDVSRMPKHLKSRMEQTPISPEELLQHQPWWVTPGRHKKKILRRHFGKYGKQSAVDASCLWPSKAELSEMEELERLSTALPLKSAMEEIAMERKKAEEEAKNREKDVLEKYAKLNSLVEEFHKRKEKKLSEALEQKKKKEKLIEEVRVFLGYQVDVHDERFQEIVANKEKEERKAAKEARKKEKIARELAKIKAREEKELAKEKESAKEQESAKELHSNKVKENKLTEELDSNKKS